MNTTPENSALPQALEPKPARDIAQVIAQILDVAPDLEPVFASLIESISYAAPELRTGPMLWNRAANVLNEHALEHPRSDDIARIFTGGAVPLPKLQRDVTRYKEDVNLCQLQHTPFPWIQSTVGDPPGQLLDARGFFLLECEDVAILSTWGDLPNIMHWGNAPGVSYIERSDAQVQANVDLILAIPTMLDALQHAEHYLRLTSAASDEGSTLARVRHALAAASPTYNASEWVEDEETLPQSRQGWDDVTREVKLPQSRREDDNQ